MSPNALLVGINKDPMPGTVQARGPVCSRPTYSRRAASSKTSRSLVFTRRQPPSL